MMHFVRTVSMFAILLAFTACGSKSPKTSGPAAAAAAATVFPGAQFVPAKATYVVSTTSMRDAQDSLRAIADVIGMPAGFEVSDVSQTLAYLIGVDALSADAVANIGVDLKGSLVLFSEDYNPTFVVRINSPEAITAFFEQERDRGLKTTSVVVADTEVFTAKISGKLSVSWAQSGEWLWVHFAIGAPDGTAWFEHSKRPGGAGWVDGWKWASALSTAPGSVTGSLDLPALLAIAAKQSPNAGECIAKLAAIKRVGLNVQVSGKTLAAGLAFDVGASSTQIGANVLAPPPGWDTAAANAPLSAQWNFDLRVGAGWIQSCFGKVDDRGNNIGGPPDFVSMLDRFGVRTGRVFVHKVDIDDKEGVGAISADLSNARFIRAQLDEIPHRGMFESSRTFGAYKGKHISVPFIASADYVLEDSFAIAAMGDGVLARVGSAGAKPAGPPPIASADVRPQGLSVGVWTFLFEQAGAPDPKRFAQRLMTWSDLHVGARLDGDKLLIEAAGTRR